MSQDFASRLTTKQTKILTRESGGIVPVRWYNWRVMSSAYQQMNLSTGVWLDMSYTSVLPQVEDGNQGTHYGSGAMGNDSGRTITGKLSIDGTFTTNGTAQNYSFGVGFWNGASYDIDPLTEDARAISASSTGLSSAAGFQQFEWEITLPPSGRFNFQVKRNTGGIALRVHNMSVRFVENN